MSYGLPSTSRLKSRSSITSLFASHRTRTSSPLRCMYAVSDGSSKVMVSVPKRLFKRAVKRNLLKRRIREAYRQCSAELLYDKSYHIAIVYTSTRECSSEEIARSVRALLTSISNS